MDFKGTIPEGYGKGKVNLAFRDKIEIIESTTDKIGFNVYKGSTTEKYTLVRWKGNDWLLINHTPTTRSRPQVPSSKPKYKEVKYEEVSTINPYQYLAPKLDGAHNTFILQSNKPIEVYSYRPTKKSTTGRIEHTFRTDL